MLKIRLMRIGAKKKPFYRVVAVDERSKRTGGYLELLGTYNPLTEPKDIKLNKERIDHWVKQGAQPSVGYLRIIGKAPQRHPRKAKKEAKKEPSAHQPSVGAGPQSSDKTEAPAETQQETPKENPKETTSEQPTQESTPAETPTTEPTQSESIEQPKEEESNKSVS